MHSHRWRSSVGAGSRAVMRAELPSAGMKTKSSGGLREEHLDWHELKG